MSSVADKLLHIAGRDDIPSDVRSALELVVTDHPETKKLGLEGYVLTADSDHMLATQFEVLRGMMRIAEESEPSCTPMQFKKTLKRHLPWIVPHLPNWWSPYADGAVVTEGTIVTLTYHFLQVAFDKPNLKSEWLLDPSRNVEKSISRRKEGFASTITTTSGTSDITIVLKQPVVDSSTFIVLSRADVVGDARQGFPRRAVTVEMLFNEDGSIEYVTDTETVSLHTTERIQGLHEVIG